jgi:hypothetical protein
VCVCVCVCVCVSVFSLSQVLSNSFRSLCQRSFISDSLVRALPQPPQQHHRAPSPVAAASLLRQPSFDAAAPTPGPSSNPVSTTPAPALSFTQRQSSPTVDEENENETADLLDTLEAEEKARRATAEAAALSTHLANSAATVTD